MSDAMQRLFMMSGPEAMSLNAQAALGPVRQPERSQYSHLIRHFLERFFNNEATSPDGSTKARMIVLALATGLPGFIVAIYLWPVYHQFIRFRQDHPLADSIVPYWVQVNHHFFFVMYSFVAMGIITVFEWDLFFPDLLDLFVLGTLPLAQRRVFLARIGAMALFIGGFLFDSNFLAPIVLPMAVDPTNLPRFVGGHVIAVTAGGIFAAGFILALQSILLSALGERIFRRVSLIMQGCAVSVLVVLLLLFPVLSSVTPTLLQSGGTFAQWFPPFWFLAIDQRILEGPSALPIFAELAQRGSIATILVVVIALALYPIAYLRRVRQIVEGSGTHARASRLLRPLHALLHWAAVRSPIRRGIFHFVGQTLLGIPRYRIYLALYGGVGLAVVAASMLRLTTYGQTLHAEFSADGIRVATGIVAFWVVAGLRTAFVSSGNSRASWIFRSVHGKPAHFDAAVQQLSAVKTWLCLIAGIVTVTAVAALQFVAPPELQNWPSTAAQLLVGIGLCVLLTDIFFAGVLVVPFTGDSSQQQDSLAFTLLKYFTIFPVVCGASIISSYWLETSWLHFGLALLILVVAHLWLRYRYRDTIRLYSAQPELEEGEDDFPMRLGLRY